MQEYTWDDIIINPTLEEARNCIGKEVYYDDSPTSCLYCANNDTDYYMILKEIEPDKSYPFILENNLSCACIILKKGKKSEKYVPFESADEFLNAYENSKYNVIKVTRENKLISCGGIWLKSKCEAIWITQCTEVADHGIVLGLSHEFMLWKELLDGYRFLDGTPCGKLKKVNNE